MSFPSIHKQLLFYFSLVVLTNHKLASWMGELGVGWENMGNTEDMENTESMKNMENMERMENIDQMTRNMLFFIQNTLFMTQCTLFSCPGRMIANSIPARLVATRMRG